MSPLETLRSAGWTQADIATATGFSKRTIQRIEAGVAQPHPSLQRALYQAVAKINAKKEIPTRRIRVDSFRHYLGKPGSRWLHWPAWKRCQWLRWSRYYRRILEDMQAGRCVVKWVHQRRRENPTLSAKR